jgi:hypothetical protein
MLYLKLMADEDLPDTDPVKGFRIIQIPDAAQIKFNMEAQDPDLGDFHTKYPRTLTIDYNSERREKLVLYGNAYVMNEAGKTIATYWGGPATSS